jgi:hypothetical protein
VSPDHLRTAARALEDVAEFVSGLATGESLAAASAAVPGLLTATACEFAGAMFDEAANLVRGELANHSAKLSSAAEQHDRVDEDYGRRLRALHS